MSETAAIKKAAVADRVNARLKRRYAAERRFRLYGLFSVAIALSFLAILFANIIQKGYSAFVQHQVQLEIYFDPEVIDPEGAREFDVLSRANYASLVKRAIDRLFPEVDGRREKRALRSLVSSGAAFDLRGMVLDDPGLIGKTQMVWVPVDDDVDMYMKGFISPDVPERARRLNDQQIGWVDQLVDRGLIEGGFNTRFLTSGDSREPELAGVWGAIVGSFFTLLVTLLLAFPIGVMTAVYLEEFAPKTRLTDLIEVNINNLAAVPSIVFGLLGLALFLNFFHWPRSAPLVGGMVLALMTLPTVIITGRAALQAVPPSLREAALAVGASPIQTVLHHVLPAAMPGVLTGTIIGMARALGETAPLLMIGMVAFIADVPQGPLDPATALPVQVFIWADAPERGFVEKTGAATLVLLLFLIAMNGLAVYLRQKFEKRW
jgi:phosphate transport system permease protein